MPESHSLGFSKNFFNRCVTPGLDTWSQCRCAAKCNSSSVHLKVAAKAIESSSGCMLNMIIPENLVKKIVLLRTSWIYSHTHTSFFFFGLQVCFDFILLTHICIIRRMAKLTDRWTCCNRVLSSLKVHLSFSFQFGNHHLWGSKLFTEITFMFIPSVRFLFCLLFPRSILGAI